VAQAPSRGQTCRSDRLTLSKQRRRLTELRDVSVFGRIPSSHWVRLDLPLAPIRASVDCDAVME